MKEKIEVFITAEQRAFLQGLVGGPSGISSIGEAAAWLIDQVINGAKQKGSGKDNAPLAASVKRWELEPAPMESVDEVRDATNRLSGSGDRLK